jgi:hypothetical protein
MTQTKVDRFQLIDHGIEWSHYFQGCGTAFTDYDNVVTGIGDNPAEAISDCLDQIGSMGFDADDLEKRMLAEEGLTEWPDYPSVNEDEDEDEYRELPSYHVSIRWS